jgi:hypothetical protein
MRSSTSLSVGVLIATLLDMGLGQACVNLVANGDFEADQLTSGAVG